MKDPQRVSYLRKFTDNYDWPGLEFPVSIKDIGKFETRNNISVNVLAVEGRDIYIHRKGWRMGREINYLARRSLCEIINSTLVCSFIDGLQIRGTLFRTCIKLKSKQRESGASQSPCSSQMRSEMRLCLFLQKEMR